MTMLNETFIAIKTSLKIFKKISIMKNITAIYLTIFCIFSISNYAQNAKVSRADKKYDNYAYIDAIKTYERIVEKGYESQDIYQKLGNAYFFNSELDQAVKWYDRLFVLTSDVDPVYYYRYAYCLRSTGDIAKANEMLKIYVEKSGSNKEEN